ncbi:ROK family protein [Patescibacteria group bacterium]|nr:ROK family protein [Patescibacteria group bacterium]MBU4512128.1 ROK family protein [Patescibacteria group bacterium]MCG2692515.1 ROK family protein [Candidatus Parcubacteria bacterium]
MSIIGLDIGATKMTAGVLRGAGLKKVKTCQTKAKGTTDEILSQIFGLFDGLVNNGVKAIGVGVPGLVDEKGVVYEAVNIPAWDNMPLKKILEKKYQIPVYVNNDANCFALGKKYFGKGKKYNNIAGVTLGTGMGTGLIIDGKLYSGTSGGAGEFGQIKYLDGVMEDYSSGKFFIKKYKISGDEIFKLARKGDKKSLKIFDEFGYHLGKALSIIAYAIDPEIIILGGSVSEAFKFFEKSMKKSLKESSYKKTYSRLKIAVSNNPQGALLGAAALCLLEDDR